MEEPAPAHSRKYKPKAFYGEWRPAAKKGKEVPTAASTPPIPQKATKQPAPVEHAAGSTTSESSAPSVPQTWHTAHGAAAEVELKGSAPLLRVAGLGRRKDDGWCEEYESYPARCDDMSPYGMASDYQIFHVMSGDLLIEDTVPQKIGHTVLIQGLPAELCEDRWLHVILEQAGLKGANAVCQRGNGSGEALVWVSDRGLAEQIVWHFNACHWDFNHSTGTPVHACLVDTAPMPELYSEEAHAQAESVLDALLAPMEDWPTDGAGNFIQAPLRLMPTEAEVADQGYTVVMVPLSTIWEGASEDWESKELGSTEVSTDAGASGTSSKASEAGDSLHEGDEVAD